MTDSSDHDRDPGAAPGPPVTGEADVDHALAGLTGLASAPLVEHPEQLARVHERLHQALHRDGS